MDGFLKEKNLLSLIVWDRAKECQQINDYKFWIIYVNINIEIFDQLSLIRLEDFYKKFKPGISN